LLFFPHWFYESKTSFSTESRKIAGLLKGTLVNRRSIAPDDFFQPQFVNSILEQVMVIHACLRVCSKKSQPWHDPQTCHCDSRCRIAFVCKHDELKCDKCKDFKERDYHSKRNHNYVVLTKENGFHPNFRKDF
jgi:hypothetical protein